MLISFTIIIKVGQKINPFFEKFTDFYFVMMDRLAALYARSAAAGGPYAGGASNLSASAGVSQPISRATKLSRALFMRLAVRSLRSRASEA